MTQFHWGPGKFSGFSSAVISTARFDRADFASADLDSADLASADFAGAGFTYCRLDLVKGKNRAGDGPPRGTLG